MSEAGGCWFCASHVSVIVFQAWKSEGEELPRQASLTGIVPACLFAYESTG
jgi:hypothetical protein